MVSRSINLDELRVHLNDAKDRISLEKQEILKLNPLADDFSREEYAFAYKRAERFGMRAINRRLAEISLSDGHSSMKRWLKSAFASKPDAEEFGNDFIHALARCGMKHGWEHPELVRLSSRVANLFRDLSCLIGLIYYCTWLTENSVEDVQLSNPDDLTRSAEEIAALIQSPELYRYLRAKEQDTGRDEDRISEQKASKKAKEAGKKSPPALRVIENDDYYDPFSPDPLPI